MSAIHTLGELRTAGHRARSVKQEIRDNLVRFSRIPLYVRVASLPELAVGSQVEVEVSDIDLITLAFDCRYKGQIGEAPEHGKADTEPV